MLTNASWTVAGLTLDLVGGFLVSAEAIGLDNLRSLWERLAGAEARLHWPIHWEETSDGKKVMWVPKRPSWLLVHLTGAALLIAIAAPLTYRPVGALIGNLREWLSMRPIWLAILASVGLLYVGWFLLFGLAELAVHGIAGGSLKLAARLLIWTRSHAKDGLAGSIGFGFLGVGFLLQAVGAVV